jgi:hypothetical protein
MLYGVHLTAINLPNSELNLYRSRSTGSQEPDSRPIQKKKEEEEEEEEDEEEQKKSISAAV